MSHLDYCRHCAEPLAGPRESDGVCQRCWETETTECVLGITRDEWLLMPSEKRTTVIESLFGVADGDLPTRGTCEDALERELDDVDRFLAGLADKTAPDTILPVDEEADAVVAGRVVEVTGWLKTRPITAHLDLSSDALAATAEAASASVGRAKAALEEATLKKWYEDTKRDPDNEQLVRSFERAYPAAKRFGSDKTEELAAGPRCSICSSEAVVRVELSEGCVCRPNDRVQDLCPHHALRSEPLGTAKTVRDYSLGGRFTELYGTPVPRLGSDGPDDGGEGPAPAR